MNDTGTGRDDAKFAAVDAAVEEFAANGSYGGDTPDMRVLLMIAYDCMAPVVRRDTLKEAIDTIEELPHGYDLGINALATLRWLRDGH